jgi:hypothetical protein
VKRRELITLLSVAAASTILPKTDLCVQRPAVTKVGIVTIQSPTSPPFAAFTQRLATICSDVLTGGKSGGGTISKSFRVDCKRDVVMHLTGLIDQ